MLCHPPCWSNSLSLFLQTNHLFIFVSLPSRLFPIWARLSRSSVAASMTRRCPCSSRASLFYLTICYIQSAALSSSSFLFCSSTYVELIRYHYCLSLCDLHLTSITKDTYSPRSAIFSTHTPLSTQLEPYLFQPSKETNTASTKTRRQSCH